MLSRMRGSRKMTGSSRARDSTMLSKHIRSAMATAQKRRRIGHKPPGRSNSHALGPGFHSGRLDFWHNGSLPVLRGLQKAREAERLVKGERLLPCCSDLGISIRAIRWSSCSFPLFTWKWEFHPYLNLLKHSQIQAPKTNTEKVKFWDQGRGLELKSIKNIAQLMTHGRPRNNRLIPTWES